MNDDIISRQAAIDALIKLSGQRDAWDNNEGYAQKRGIAASICTIEDLPSAERHGRKRNKDESGQSDKERKRTMEEPPCDWDTEEGEQNDKRRSD